MAAHNRLRAAFDEIAGSYSYNIKSRFIREDNLKNQPGELKRYVFFCKESACQSAVVATRAPCMLNGAASPYSAGAF
jgi:hypothetical protein